MNANPMNVSPSSDTLEQRAVLQRSRIHQTALELISKVDEAKQQLSLEHHLRKHFLPAALIACSLSLISGYVVGEIFARR